MALENPSWGYTRIRGALSNLGFVVSRGTIANIPREHGIEPAFERRKRLPWRTFLKAHWEVLAAADFFTVEVARPFGLATYYVLFVMELSSRRIHQRALHGTNITSLGSLLGLRGPRSAP